MLNSSVKDTHQHFHAGGCSKHVGFRRMKRASAFWGVQIISLSPKETLIAKWAVSFTKKG